MGPAHAIYLYTYAGDRLQTIFVFDLGGGTFDVSLARLTFSTRGKPVAEILSHHGCTTLGGNDFDLRLRKEALDIIYAQ